MKIPIQEIDEEKIRKNYPIIGKVKGWFFRQKEISNGAWEVEGMDQWGRKVSQTGDDPYKLLEECEAAAQEINKQIKRT